MYVLIQKGNKQDGAYAIETSEGLKVLQIFQEEDDANRYAGLLESDGFSELEVFELDTEEALQACIHLGYNYCVITSEDFVIPSVNNKYDFI